MKKKILSFIITLCLLIPCGFVFSACNKSGEERTIYFNVGTSLYATEKSCGYEAIDLPENPTKVGYSFDGWYLDSKLTEAFDNKKYVESAIPQNISVYAKFTANDYTITFDSQGGTAVSSITAKYGEAISEPIAPTRDYPYVFAGWRTSLESKENFNFTTMPANNLTLYACWDVVTYNITYANISASEKAGLVSSYTILDSTITLGSVNRGGYTFEGWYLEADFINEIETIEPIIKKDVVLYAKFSVNKYTISYIPNNGSTIATEELDFGASLNLPTPEKEGYTFEGWYLDQYLSNKFALDSMPASNLTLFAKWSEKVYKIAYVLSGVKQNEPYQTQNYTVSSTVTLSTPVLDKAYKFEGWYADADFETLVENFDESQAKNVTLYGKVSYNYVTITFDVGEGEAVEAIEDVCGSTITLPTAVRTGYTFLGWADKDGNPVSLTEMPEEDITLYARWQENE